MGESGCGTPLGMLVLLFLATAGLHAPIGVGTFIVTVVIPEKLGDTFLFTARTDSVVSIRAPTRFVWGERDAFAPPASGRDLARRMPRARFVEVQDTGHLPWLDDPESVVRAIREELG